MKKVLFSAVSALAIAGVACADSGVDSTVVGTQTIQSSAPQIIVSIPWLASAATNASVKVADLVRTANLNAGDELKYYNGEKYECWKLNDSKIWEPSTEVSETTITKVAGATDATLNMGQAIILKRYADEEKGTTISDKVYLVGKPATAPTSMDLPKGKYTLIAPPNVGENGWDINGDGKWTGLTDGLLYIPDANGQLLSTTYRYVEGSWKNTATKSEEGTIPVGTGAWLYTKSENATVTW